MTRRGIRFQLHDEGVIDEPVVAQTAARRGAKFAGDPAGGPEEQVAPERARATAAHVSGGGKTFGPAGAAAGTAGQRQGPHQEAGVVELDAEAGEATGVGRSCEGTPASGITGAKRAQGDVAVGDCTGRQARSDTDIPR